MDKIDCNPVACGTDIVGHNVIQNLIVFLRNIGMIGVQTQAFVHKNQGMNRLVSFGIAVVGRATEENAEPKKHTQPLFHNPNSFRNVLSTGAL